MKKILLVILAAALLAGGSQLQRAMNRERDKLGLTRVEPLKNAPPVLAFTTVALGGFRGLISNALWIRANDLQDEDKFFEMAQLADWITKLEPHFVQVWTMQAWNMAYNISVKFKDFPDRWRWVRRGIELLRDEGLQYNPNEILIYRELAWFFQHKLGQNLDDAATYYKEHWAEEMDEVFGHKPLNLEELVHPTTPDQTNRANIIITKYKMDPAFMKQVDDKLGPLEWRLPEAHAIYWASLGLREAKRNPTKVNPDDFITLRRVVYQSMQLSFKRGRLVPNPFVHFAYGPNLDIVAKVSASYEEEADEDPKMRDHILSAHRNFLRDAVYFLYENNRTKEANEWFKYLCKQYPNKPLLDGQFGSMPGTLSLDDYAIGRVQELVKGTLGQDDAQAVIEGMLRQYYGKLVTDQDAGAATYFAMAKALWAKHMDEEVPTGRETLKIPPLDQTAKKIRDELLDPVHGYPPPARAALRSKLNLPPETKAVKEAATTAPVPSP